MRDDPDGPTTLDELKKLALALSASIQPVHLAVMLLYRPKVTLM